VAGLLAAMLWLGAVGCELPPGQTDSAALPPVLERIRRAYPELASGRFVALASFESAREAELFRVVDAHGASESRDQPWINVLRAREESGVGSLTATLSERGDALLFDGVRSQGLSLLRDWRPYSLMLMALFAPPQGQTLELSIESGSASPLRWNRTLNLSPGWNLLRFDLAEIGDEIDLSDVRRLAWRAPRAAGPLELSLDDLILADNTQTLLERDDSRPQLYAFRQGRRIHVGAAGRFELAFSDGVITSWQAGEGLNLTVRSGLGPWPIPLPPGWDSSGHPVVYDDPRLFSSWGEVVGASQQVLEKSPGRIVIEGRWVFLEGGSPPGTAPAARPSHSWRYVIYPDGSVYVRTVSDGRGAGWPAALAGYALALDGRRGFARLASPPLAAPRDGTGYVLMARAEPGRADLLWCPHDRGLATSQIELVSNDARRVAVVAGQGEAAPVIQAAHLLRFWPTDLDGLPEAESHAGDYQQPARLHFSRGRAVLDAQGDLNGDGFNESEGCYELATEEGVARFVFDPVGRLRHRPLFRVQGTTGLRCWVYVDGRVVTVEERDALGEVLFAIPGPLGMSVGVEVHARP
jgi:hypothetical protein